MKESASSYEFLAMFLSCSVIVGFTGRPCSEGSIIPTFAVSSFYRYLFIFISVQRVEHHILTILRFRKLSSAMCYDCADTLKLFIEKRFDSSRMKLTDDTKFLSTMFMAIDRFHVKNHTRMTCKTFMRPDIEIHNNIHPSINT